MKKLIFVLLLFSNSCIDAIDDRELFVFNSSNNSIFSVLSPNDDMNGSNHYYEYMTEERYKDAIQNNKIIFNFTPIISNTKVSNHDAPRSWDSFFNKTSDGKLRLFIISADSVNKYGWTKIFQQKIYNKKYLFTKEDLNNDDWVINYKD